MKVFEDMKQAIVLLLSLSLSIGVAFSQSELVESPSGLIVEDLDVTQATLRWNNQTNVASWIVSYRVFQQEQSNQLTTSDTVAYLQELGIDAERRSIYRDIDEINKALWLLEKADDDATIIDAEKAINKKRRELFPPFFAIEG